MAHKTNSRILRAAGYAETVALQREILGEIADNPERPGEVLFVEHTPVVTCGRSGDGTNLLVAPERLRAEGVDYFEAGRGGDVTYHGPGQWTVYPILRMEWYGKDLHHYLRLLEECVIRFLSQYGIDGGRREKLTGVWVENEKVAAVGVAVSRWVSWHGFAVNINIPAAAFTRYMHPCGIKASEGGVGSLDRLLGREVAMDEALSALKGSVAEVLELIWT